MSALVFRSHMTNNGVLFSKNYKRYLAYWESIRDKFPKEFAEAYWGTKFSDVNHFHDYQILRFSMIKNVQGDEHGEDTIELVIGGARGAYEFHFSQIYVIYCSFIVLEDGASDYLLPDILQSLIGISEEGNYIFEFVTLDRGRFRIEFEEVRVVEHTLNSYAHQQQSEN